MTTNKKDRVLVVLQMTGAYDALNTVIPYNDPHYVDYRQAVSVDAADVLHINDEVGFHPAMHSIKGLYDQGKVAVIQGIGYPVPNRSHFRSLDIWHTAEPAKIITEGWLGKVIRDLDPHSENVLTGVNFGRGLPRAMALPGVPVASVAVLENYGLLTAIPQDDARARALDVFARMYSPAMGTGPTMDYLGQTGLDALKGADILRTAPEKYQSTVEYADNAIARNLRAISQVLLADLGTRVFYTQHGGYDTHAAEMAVHTQLWTELSDALSCFFADLREHNVEDRVVMLVFTEFGRRVKDNGSGSDHGSGGLSMVMGAPVNGGQYNEFPSMRESDLLEGDLHFSYDYRGLYATLVERWLGLDGKAAVGGSYEMLGVV